MSSPVFQPHGLIQDPEKEALYNIAHISTVYNKVADPKEYHTTILMEAILGSIFAAGDNFRVASQQPPSDQSRKRCDLVIKYFEPATQKFRVLCFAECKRTRTIQPSGLKALEKQVGGYCRLYLESEGKDFVYAATITGAHIRLWRMFRDEVELEPLWGTGNPGDWGQYKDVGDDKAGQEIEDYFRRMKEAVPIPPTDPPSR